MKDTLAARAWLAEMTTLACLSAGFTIQTEAVASTCAENEPRIDVEMLARSSAWRSCRSGTRRAETPAGLVAPAQSSPCRHDGTILNLASTTSPLKAVQMQQRSRFAYDSYRRLIQMFGSVVLDISRRS